MFSSGFTSGSSRRYQLVGPPPGTGCTSRVGLTEPWSSNALGYSTDLTATRSPDWLTSTIFLAVWSGARNRYTSSPLRGHCSTPSGEHIAGSTPKLHVCYGGPHGHRRHTSKMIDCSRRVCGLQYGRLLSSSLLAASIRQRNAPLRPLQGLVSAGWEILHAMGLPDNSAFVGGGGRTGRPKVAIMCSGRPLSYATGAMCTDSPASQ
jgi:hypothetical protein